MRTILLAALVALSAGCTCAPDDGTKCALENSQTGCEAAGCKWKDYSTYRGRTMITPDFRCEVAKALHVKCHVCSAAEDAAGACRFGAIMVTHMRTWVDHQDFTPDADSGESFKGCNLQHGSGGPHPYHTLDQCHGRHGNWTRGRKCDDAQRDPALTWQYQERCAHAQPDQSRYAEHGHAHKCFKIPGANDDGTDKCSCCSCVKEAPVTPTPAPTICTGACP